MKAFALQISILCAALCCISSMKPLGAEQVFSLASCDNHRQHPNQPRIKRACPCSPALHHDR